MDRVTNKLGWLLVVATALATLAFGAACGDDGDDSEDVAAIEAAIQATVDAWNSGDIEGFLAGFTENGFLVEFDAPKDAGREFLPDFIGDPPITRGDIEVEVSGDTATVTALEFAFGKVLDPGTFTMVNQEGAWVFDDTSDVPAPIPDDTTAVDLMLLEYLFSFDASLITEGNFAFSVSNIGGEEHELALFMIPEGISIEEALDQEDPPENVSFIGVGGPWDPGTDTTVVFTEPLEAGRYAMICFVETADGVPHFTLGMVDEFTVR